MGGEEEGRREKCHHPPQLRPWQCVYCSALGLSCEGLGHLASSVEQWGDEGGRGGGEGWRGEGGR